jgi:hypothetical protein
MQSAVMQIDWDPWSWEEHVFKKHGVFEFLKLVQQADSIPDAWEYIKYG